MADLIQNVVIAVVSLAMLLGLAGSLPKSKALQNIQQGFDNLTIVLGGK
jgi:hypothetical protein